MDRGGSAADLTAGVRRGGTGARLRAAVGVSTPARRLAARRATRTGVVTAAAFALGRWGLDSVAAAVFATFVGLAITGFADFGGPRAGRVRAVATTTVWAVGLTALGTQVSTQQVWIGCAAMFAVVTVIVMSCLLGEYAAAGSNALILSYLVAAGSPAPAAAIPERVAGVALGGALALVAAVSLWPEPVHSRTLPTLGAELQRLAGRLDRRADDVPAPPAPAPPGVRATIDALVDRPAGPAGPQRAALHLLNDVERLDGLATGLDRTPEVAVPDRAVLRRAALVLDHCGRALCAAPSRHDADSGHTIGVLGVSSAVPDHPFSVCARLAATTDAAAAHARAALDASCHRRLSSAFTTGPRPASRTGGLVEAVRHQPGLLRADLTLRSVQARDALRLAAGLTVATAAVAAFGLQHGFWVAFATLTVIKSNLRATGRSARDAVIGSGAGLLAAAVVISQLRPGPGWYLALLPVVMAFAIYANVAIDFLAGQAGFTLAIIVLFNLLGPAGWRIGLVRVVDVVAGVAAALALGALAWPRGAGAHLPKAAADLLEDAAGYLAGTARAFAVGPEAGEAGAGGRRSAMDAAVRAESTFAQYLAEHPPADAVRGWAHWLSAGDRLWYAADLISTAPRDRAEPPGPTLAAADRLAEGYRALAAALRTRRTPPEPVGGGEGRAGGGAGLPVWLDDLAAESAYGRGPP